MDFRIEIEGILYIPESNSHELLHEDAKRLAKELGKSSYRIVSIIVEGVSDSFNVN